jgi:GNAT superfamily N-acetyltransferase
MTVAREQQLAVRPATVDDVGEVVRLGGLMFESMGETEFGFLPSAERILRAGIEQGTMAAFVVDDPARAGVLIAGCAGVVWHRLPGPSTPRGRCGYVQYVWTDPDHRSRGLGRGVVSELLDWFEARQVPVVELHATPEGEPLYRSMGFSELSTPHLRLRRDPGGTAPAEHPAD